MAKEIRLYCPKCDRDVFFDQATEISERHCPTILKNGKLCGAQANELWPTKVMYDRHIAYEERSKAPKPPEPEKPVIVPLGPPDPQIADLAEEPANEPEILPPQEPEEDEIEAPDFED